LVVVVGFCWVVVGGGGVAWRRLELGDLRMGMSGLKSCRDCE
jgi:hypothetical protein